MRSRLVAIVLGLIGGCTLTTPLDSLGPRSTTQAATTGVGGMAGAGGGELGGGSVTPTLAATAMNHHRIELVWTSGFDSVDIERDGIVIRSAVTGTRFQDRGLEPSKLYSYRIRAGSTWSLPASAMTAAEPMGSYFAQVVSDEPRAYWPMEQLELDDAMGNVSAGNVAGLALLASGRVGNGVWFDGMTGTAYLGRVHTADSDWGWSWELWIYVEALPVDESGLLGCDNTPRFTMYPTGTLGGGMGRRSDLGFVAWTGSVPDLDSWHHVVLTVEAAITNTPSLKFYADGELVSSQPFGEPVHSPWSRGNAGQNGEGDLHLNRRDGYSGLQGIYDEAAVYDYVLSAAQIKRHYLAAAPP